MAMQRTFFERAKSITGVALIALGIFIFGENLGPAVSQLSHVLDTIPREALGAVSTLVLAALRVVQAYPADHQRFLQALLHQMLLSSWPLLLVAIGTALSRDALTDTVNTLTKKNCGLVDLTGGLSTLK